MPSPSVVLHDLRFAHPSSPVTLFEDLSAHFSVGWTGIVGANGAGKTSLLRLACGELQPQAGSASVPINAIYCAQRTETPPPELQDFLESADAEAGLLASRLRIGWDFRERWDTLSEGERKRAQVAVALWRAPDLLAIDEPTNHVDREARELLAEALSAFPGVGLLVSHDRALLDSLCSHCLFLEPAGAVLRPGTFSEGSATAEAETVSRRHAREEAGRERKRLERSAHDLEAVAALSKKRLSKRGLAIRDHDARAKIDKARVSGKDARPGRAARQAGARAEHARQRERALDLAPEYELGVHLLGARSPRDLLFRLPAGTIPLGPERVLRHGALSMAPGDRIALTGPNGAGKSTLLRRIVAQLNVPPERSIILPQEVDAATALSILDEARALPGPRLGQVMTLLARLNSRPRRLLDSRQPSPGETRKLLLALGLEREAWLLVADEPTNHLDLPSMTALENALSDFAGGLLLVSHDERFLEALTTGRWRTDVDAEGNGQVHGET